MCYSYEGLYDQNSVVLFPYTVVVKEEIITDIIYR